MKAFSRKTRILLALSLVAGLSVIALIEFSSVCTLQAVTLDDRPITDIKAELGLKPHKPLVRQPVERLAAKLLDKKGVFRVDISFQIPHGIALTTNAFTPVCFALDDASGKMYGLNHKARVTELSRPVPDWERPVITGAKTRGLYRYMDDIRTIVVVEQLEQLRNTNPSLYRLIEQIDLSQQREVRVNIAGLPYTVRLRAEMLACDLDRFVAFITHYAPPLDSVRTIDLRFDNLIITAQKG